MQAAVEEKRNHMIKKKDKKPIKLFTLDTETRGFKGEIFRIGLFDGENYFPANDFKTIKQILLRESITHDPHIFIHNLNFDLGKIMHDLALEILWFPSIIINGRSTIIKTNNFTFHDSFSLFPKSLEKLSKDFAIKNRKMDLLRAVDPKYIIRKTKIVKSYFDEEKDEYIKIEEPTNEIDEQKTKENYFMNVDPLEPLLNEYLEFDCKSLFEIIRTAIDISGMKEKDFLVCPTTASLSLKAFQTLFKEDYEIAISSKFVGRDLEIEKKLKKGYYGGRTEVFIPILKNGFHYDMNSEYPYVMGKAGLKYPVGEYKDLAGAAAKIQWKLYSRTEQGGGIVKATVKIPKDMEYPILPYRAYKEGKLLFPAGEITASWTAVELLFAQRRGVEILQVHEFIYFYRMENLFERFVSHFEKMKKDNTFDPLQPDRIINPSLREYAKLILNALYGKFATGREKRSYVSLKELPDAIAALEKKEGLFDPEIGFFNNTIAHGVEYAKQQYYEHEPTALLKRMPARFKHTGIDETILQFTNYLTADYVQIQISCYVTAYARMELYKGIEKVIARGGKVYYCDTDSIVTDKPMDETDVHDSEFGKWKLENKIKNGFFLQPKVYGEELESGDFLKKFKGMPNQKVKSFNIHDYKYILKRQAKKDIERIQLLKKDEGFKNIIKPISAIKRDKDFNELLNVEKSLNIRGMMEKREMDYDNNISRPIVFDGSETNSETEYLKELMLENIKMVQAKNPFLLQLEQGFIKIPDRKTEDYFEYQQLKEKTKKKYFRKSGKQTIQQYADGVYYTVEDLFVELSLES